MVVGDDKYFDMDQIFAAAVARLASWTYLIQIKDARGRVGQTAVLVRLVAPAVGRDADGHASQ
jgi:hypothetical protein